MTYYGNSVYSFSTVAESFKNDKRMLQFFLDTDRETGVVASSPLVEELIVENLASTEPNCVSVMSVANDALHQGTFTLEQILGIATDVRNSKPELFGTLVIGGLESILTDNIFKENVSESTRQTIFDMLMGIVEGAEREEDASRIISELLYNVEGSEFHSTLIDRAMELCEHYAHVEGSPTYNTIQMGNSRYYFAPYGSFIRTLESEFAENITREQYLTLLNSSYSSSLSMADYALTVSNAEGDMIIEFMKANGPIAEGIIDTVTGAQDNEAKKIAATSAIEWLLKNPELTQDDRDYVYSRILHNYPNIADQHMDDIKASVSAAVTQQIVRGLDNTHDIQHTFIRAAHPQHLDFILTEIKNAENRSTAYNGIYQTISMLVSRTRPLIGTDIEERPTTDYLNNLWDYLNDHPYSASGYGKDPVTNLQIQMIITGSVNSERIQSVAKGNSRLAKAAREALGDAAATPKRRKKEETPDSWDKNVSEYTDFSHYSSIAREAGFTPVAALALYATDARIEFGARVAARRDLIELLNVAPEYADGIPDKAWTGLSRVRDSLGMSMELAIHLNTLGGVAAKVGSKNLVKSALI